MASFKVCDNLKQEFTRNISLTFKRNILLVFRPIIEREGLKVQPQKTTQLVIFKKIKFFNYNILILQYIALQKVKSVLVAINGAQHKPALSRARAYILCSPFVKRYKIHINIWKWSKIFWLHSICRASVLWTPSPPRSSRRGGASTSSPGGLSQLIGQIDR